MFGLPLPPWLSPTFIGAILIGLVAAAGGAWTAHKIDSISYSKLEASKAVLQSQYDGYRATVATATAKANADALAQQTALQHANDALQNQLQATQRTANARSQQLQALLASATKPGDTRPIGDIAGAYYERLRQPAVPPNPASPGNP